MSHLAPLVYSSVIDSLSLRRRLVHAATPATRAGVPGFGPAGITNKVGCPVLRGVCEGRVPRALAAEQLRRSMPERNRGRAQLDLPNLQFGFPSRDVGHLSRESPDLPRPPPR